MYRIDVNIFWTKFLSSSCIAMLLWGQNFTVPWILRAKFRSPQWYFEGKFLRYPIFWEQNFAVHHDILRANFRSSTWYKLFESKISQFTMIFKGQNCAVHHDIFRANLRSSPWYLEGNILQFTVIFWGQICTVWGQNFVVDHGILRANFCSSLDI